MTDGRRLLYKQTITSHLALPLARHVCEVDPYFLHLLAQTTLDTAPILTPSARLHQQINQQ